MDPMFHTIDRSLLWAFEGTEVPAAVSQRAAAGLVSGITLFRHYNRLTKSVAADISGQLAEATGRAGQPPALVAIDQETGQFLGLGGSTPFAGNLALGAVNDVELTERVGQAIGGELRSVGITMNYAPVADIITRPDNPSLGIRSFGSDPAAVAAHVGAMVRGLRRGGVLTVAKHFPGKGEADVDPHHRLPVLELDLERLKRVELVPFQAAVDAGVDGIMMGHYALPAIDGRRDLPATVSAAVVKPLIRRHLGFDGLTITDALDMGSLAQGAGSVIEAVAALRAPLDLLLCSADLDRAESLSTGLRLAYSRGIIDDAELLRSHDRITQARKGLATMGSRAANSDFDSDFDRGAAEELAGELARRSTTLVRDEPALLPLAPGTRVVSVMVKPVDLTPADTSSYQEPGLAAALARHFDVVADVVVGHRPSGADIDRAVAAAASDRVEVVVVGTITATAEQGELVRQVDELRPTVTAALRTPFDLLTYPTATSHLCTYGLLTPSLMALADTLASGDAPGALPSPIPGLYPTGHRLVRH